ncbi:hypothetical protein ACIVBQ_002206 [Tenacibaculum discolor]
MFKATSSAKLHTNTYFVAHLEKIHQEDIINSEERLTIIPVSTKDSGYYSRILLLKVNGNIQSVIFSMYPSSTKKETNGFTGEIIITDLEGNFLKGYRANSGNLITKFTKKVLSVNKSSKGGVCPDHGECTANSLCVYCTQELDEVVVSGNTSGGSAPVDYILDFSGTESGDGSSGDPNTSMGWEYGDGGGGTSSNTTEDQIVNKLTEKAKCVYGRLETNNLLKKTLKKFNGVDAPVHLILQEGNLGAGVSGETSYGDNITITLDKEDMKNTPSLWGAHTILHEAIHAEIYRKIRTTSQIKYDPYTKTFSLPDGSRAHFPTLFDYYDKYSDNPQHNYMADYYRTAMEEGLKEYATSIGKTYPDQLYKDIAWGGLHNTNAWDNMYADPIYTQNEQKRILNSIRNFKNSGNNECD